MAPLTSDAPRDRYVRARLEIASLVDALDKIAADAHQAGNLSESADFESLASEIRNAARQRLFKED
ncbi:hypothetical protein [Roseibium sp.]|uniref:hypothetical protein n=1 Tax=Roseibium sp. TaxID=1936156 RepID=UPI00326664E1